MHTVRIDAWRHEHRFGTEGFGSAERRTRWVVALTASMMAVEIAAGTVFGSMALLADGWHMATHAAALGAAAFAYAFSRRHAADPRFSFGTGKVSALGGFASAVGLAVVAIGVFVESVSRLASPVAIRYDEAILVTVIGLVVNLVCAAILWDGHGGHSHHGEGGHDHGQEEHHHHDHGHEDHHEHAHGHDYGSHHGHRDHNLRGAYLHVMADALTSVLALVALGFGRAFGWSWMDAGTGILGSIIIARWSIGLLRESANVLLDAEATEGRLTAVRAAIESRDDNRVADLHLWRVGPRHLAAIVSVVSDSPREPEHYKGLLQGQPDLAHVTVEVHRCSESAPAMPTGA